MALQVDVLRASFDEALARDPELTRHFYEHLFAAHPEATPLFHRRSLEAQERMLGDTLAAAMDHLEDVPWLQQTLSGLGAKHVDYGVTPEMYDWVGTSLLATLRTALGADWTAEQEAAWTELYGAVAAMMLQGRPGSEPAVPRSTG
jgi:hemoglobin-like flavoprotein